MPKSVMKPHQNTDGQSPNSLSTDPRRSTHEVLEHERIGYLPRFRSSGASCAALDSTYVRFALPQVSTTTTSSRSSRASDKQPASERASERRSECVNERAHGEPTATAALAAFSSGTLGRHEGRQTGSVH